MSLDFPRSGPVGYVELPPGVSKEMKWRREAVQSACSDAEGQGRGEGSWLRDAANTLSHNPKKLINLLVDDKNRVLYCYVPKVSWWWW